MSLVQHDNADFSPKAVARAVLKDTVTKPYVLYPAAVGILGGMAALLLSPAAVFVIPAAIGGTIGAGAWAVNYLFRRDKMSRDYLERLHHKLASRAKETAAQLRQELGELGHQAGQEQLQRFASKFAACEDLLRRKLNPNEMTFGRYLGMNEQVFLAGLDNLREISEALRSVSTIDEGRARKRLLELKAQGAGRPAQQQEALALQGRIALLDKQRNKIENWLAENELAMTQMDQAMAAIADMDTALDQAQLDMQPAMQELRVLLERAHNYARSGTDVAAPAQEQNKGS